MRIASIIEQQWEEFPEHIWYITIVSQSPVQVQLFEMTRDNRLPALECLAPHEVPTDLGMHAYRHDFKNICSEQVLVLMDAQARFGIVHAAWLGDHRLVVISEFQEFDECILLFARIGPVRAPKQPRIRKPNDEVMAVLLDESP